MSLQRREALKYRTDNVTHLRRVAKPRKTRVQRLRETCGFVPYHAVPRFPEAMRQQADDANSRIFVRRFMSWCVIATAGIAAAAFFSGCGGRGYVECSIESPVAYDSEAWPYVCISGKWIFTGEPRETPQ